MLLLGEEQNLRPSLFKFICSLFNLCVDKFIILGLTFASFFILVFPPVCMVKNGFCLYSLKINFCFI